MPLSQFCKSLSTCLHTESKYFVKHLENSSSFRVNSYLQKPVRVTGCQYPHKSSCLLSYRSMHLHTYFQGSGFKIRMQNRIKRIKVSLVSNTDVPCQIIISQFCLWCYVINRRFIRTYFNVFNSNIQ